MKNLIISILFIVICLLVGLVKACVKPDFIQAQEYFTQACYSDMQTNPDITCD